MKTKLSGRFWLALVLFSLMGQVAWVVENMYFNVFIYKMFAATPEDIANMVTASAIAATLTSVLIGALSDKVGKRKLFIVGGYILWGVSILAFTLIRVDVIEAVFPMTVSAAAVGVSLVIVMDCVMTFFGSSANDAAFNAWLTDSTDDTNRGAAEGINSMMPLVAILAVFGGFMAFDLDKKESWTLIFIIIGAVVLVIGVAGIFLIKEPAIQPESESYIKTVIYGFRPSTVKGNLSLYIALIAFILFNISIQIFMPYLIIYYEVSLGMKDYVLIMAPAIILASLVTALWGKVYDKKGFGFSAKLSILWLAIGYVILYFTRTTVPVFIGSLFMMSGYLSGMAVFGAVIRDKTPVGKSGQLQGVRIFSQVLVPGVVGPAIGKAVLANADMVQGNDGTYSFVPSADIFLAALIALVFVAPIVFLIFRKKKQPLNKLNTPYTPGEPPFSGEYPRPQLRRESFTSLNGVWSLRVERDGKTTPLGEIRVPFPPESLLSGIERITQKNETLVYEKSFVYTPTDAKTLLHFGAVDTFCEVILNGEHVGSHKGGYHPFTLDITRALQGGENTLTVRAEDPLTSDEPYGKQCHRRGGMWYTPISGIWQTVWLESVPENYIRALKITPTLSSVTVSVTGGCEEKTLTVDGKTYTFTGDKITVSVENPSLWTPETPTLYPFTLTSGEDTVTSYFALREIGVRTVNGVPRFTLNGKPYFFHGVLDQGYFSDGLFLPGNENGFRDDILSMKALGFNMLRKHIKIEPDIFYYYCDKLGMAVFQDMVNNGVYSFLYDTALPTVGFKNLPPLPRTAAQKEKFLRYAEETVDLLYNHPSVVYYTIFNEGWGQHDASDRYRRLKVLDKTRIFDTASGWFRTAESDVISEHIYFKPIRLTAGDRPLVLSEFGGYSYKIDEHSFNPNSTYGYKNCPTKEAFLEDMTALYREVEEAIAGGLSAAVLTQLSDIEDETNGLLTYDRHVNKIDTAAMTQISDGVFAAFSRATAE